MDGMGQPRDAAPSSAPLDTFARDNLPPREAWPVLRFDLPELRYPARLNAAVALLDAQIAAGRGDRPAVVCEAETLTYAELRDRAARIAAVLARDLGLVPGNRVLLRSANNAWMVAAHFGVWMAGGVVVATMPLLRAKELGQVLRKARVGHALCDARLAGELQTAAVDAPDLAVVLERGAHAHQPPLRRGLPVEGGVRRGAAPGETARDP